MVMIDAISRKVDGVLNNSESSEIETFYDNLLEYPQYKDRRCGRAKEFLRFFFPETTAK